MHGKQSYFVQGTSFDSDPVHTDAKYRKCVLKLIFLLEISNGLGLPHL